MGRSNHAGRQKIVSVKSRPSALPPEAFDRIPRAQVTFTDEAAYLSRFDASGKPTVTYPVNLNEVAAAFRFLGTTTGILPDDTLFYSQCAGTDRIGIYLSPGIRTLHFDLGKRKTTQLRVPMPGFVFIGERTLYWIFAVNARPADERTPLFNVPLPNVNLDGRICAGTVKFPACTSGTIHAAANLFFESAFNHDLANDKFRDLDDEEDEGHVAEFGADDEEEMMERLYAGRRRREEQSLYQFLQTLRDTQKFPSERLVPARVTLRHFIQGAIQS